MAYREIPEGSIEIQTGLWAELYTYTVGGATRARYNLYSAEGHCFYSLNVPENFDEEGNLKPADERMYATFAMCPPTMDIDAINAMFVSVVAEEGFEIVT
jgi:hypothetical protein